MDCQAPPPSPTPETALEFLNVKQMNEYKTKVVLYSMQISYSILPKLKCHEKLIPANSI